MRKLMLCAALVAAPFLIQDPETPKGDGFPEVGKPAPVFRLNDHQGQGVTVGAKAEDWTVLAFYPKAATPG